MKTINLINKNTWKAFQYETLEDLKEEFETRNIEIGKGSILSNGLFVPNETTVGNNIRVGIDTISIDNIFADSHINYSFMSVATFNLLNF